jgi:hypothetical protein
MKNIWYHVVFEDWGLKGRNKIKDLRLKGNEIKNGIKLQWKEYLWSPHALYTLSHLFFDSLA